MKFDELRLKKPLLEAVRTAGYDVPTPIQAKAIPLILEGRDILACAQTGTGKTAAFALPILQGLGERPSSQSKDGVRNGERDGRRSRGQHRSRSIRVLVLAPTRELAQQISDSFGTYGKFSGLRHTVVYGGVNKNPQTRVLRNGVDILVATPGRLLDHMGDGTVVLDSVEVLVLDEADHMLDMGFLPDIRKILRKVSTERQTLMFSATMPPPIRVLANDILTDPESVEVARVSAPAETVEHWAYRVEKQQKPSLLCSVLETTPFSRALVFTRTKHGADKVVRYLTVAGIPAAAIHGNKSQNARTRALAGFRSGKTAVLVATDIAARGLDIYDISHVINYDLTTEPETYVHRIGRTGRAGASGVALSFISREDYGSARAIERMICTQLQLADELPGYVAPKPVAEVECTDRHERPADAPYAPRRNSPVNGQRNGHKNAQRSGPKNGQNQKSGPGTHRAPRSATKSGTRYRPRRAARNALSN
jgi:ATP-dependent RNA helicase RhlE